MSYRGLKEIFNRYATLAFTIAFLLPGTVNDSGDYKELPSKREEIKYRQNREEHLKELEDYLRIKNLSENRPYSTRTMWSEDPRKLTPKHED
ncbi:MAG: hypothetical protein GTN39_02985 [Candidatus Aenigmarchaeota archaeon]|nr:hypothetical protein [Candidatus Aenigmarchaeota archaeon]